MLALFYSARPRGRRITEKNYGINRVRAARRGPRGTAGGYIAAI